jgi:hypothetical protein
MRAATRVWLDKLVIRKNSKAEDLKSHILLLEKELVNIRTLIEIQPSNDCLGTGRANGVQPWSRADEVIYNIEQLLQDKA